MQAGPLVAAAAAVAAAVIYFLKSSTSRTRQSDRKRYLELCDLVASLRTPPPLMLVDLDAFDRNAREVAQKVHQTNPGATIRLGTKSVRVIELLKRAVRIGNSGV